MLREEIVVAVTASMKYKSNNKNVGVPVLQSICIPRKALKRLLIGNLDRL